MRLAAWLMLSTAVLAFVCAAPPEKLRIQLTIDDCDFVELAKDAVTQHWSGEKLARLLRDTVFSAAASKEAVFSSPDTVILVQKIKHVGCRAFVPVLLPKLQKKRSGAIPTVAHQVEALRADLKTLLSHASVSAAKGPVVVPKKIVLNYNYRMQVTGRKLVNTTRPFGKFKTQEELNATLPRPSSGLSWALDRITAPLGDQIFAFPSGYSALNPATVIYLIDTGILASHTQFLNQYNNTSRASVIWDAYPSQPIAGHFHGTFTMSNAIGKTLGTCPFCIGKNLRALDNSGGGYFGDIEAAIYAISQHCQANEHKRIVVNLSLGGGGANDASLVQSLADAFNEVRLKCDALIVASAGNEATDACQILPAGLVAFDKGHVIAVGATTHSDTLADFSNYGSCVTLLAPGQYITGACPGSTTELCEASGTSMSAPFVSGVAAQYQAACPSDFSALSASFLQRQKIDINYVLWSTLVRFHLFATAQTGYISGLPAGTFNRLLQISSFSAIDALQYYNYNNTQQDDTSQIVFVPDPPMQPGTVASSGVLSFETHWAWIAVALSFAWWQIMAAPQL